MSSPLARLRRAANATFFVHGASTLTALMLAAPITRRFDAALESADHDHHTWLAMVLHVSGVDVTGDLAASLLPFGAFLLLAPWLRMLWLAALAEPSTLEQAGKRGGRRYGAALTVAAIGWFYMGVGFAITVGGAMATRLALAPTHDAQLQDLAALAVAAPLLLLLSHALCVVDIADAALAGNAHTPRSALRIAWAQSRFRTVVERACVGVVCTALPMLALVASRMLASDVQRGHALVFVVGQCAALLATLLRGFWLARALDHAGS